MICEIIMPPYIYYNLFNRLINITNIIFITNLAETSAKIWICFLMFIHIQLLWFEKDACSHTCCLCINSVILCSHATCVIEPSPLLRSWHNISRPTTRRTSPSNVHTVKKASAHSQRWEEVYNNWNWKCLNDSFYIYIIFIKCCPFNVMFCSIKYLKGLVHSKKIKSCHRHVVPKP